MTLKNEAKKNIRGAFVSVSDFCKQQISLDSKLGGNIRVYRHGAINKRFKSIWPWQWFSPSHVTNAMNEHEKLVCFSAHRTSRSLTSFYLFFLLCPPFSLSSLFDFTASQFQNVPRREQRKKEPKLWAAAVHRGEIKGTVMLFRNQLIEKYVCSLSCFTDEIRLEWEGECVNNDTTLKGIFQIHETYSGEGE